MDFVKNLAGGGNNNNNAGENQQPATGSEQKSEGGFLGGIGDKLNNAAGGGAQGEKNEDGLDKGGSNPSINKCHALQFADYHIQASTSSRRSSSARARRTTRAPSSRPRTSRSPTSFVASTRATLAATSPLRTNKRAMGDEVDTCKELLCLCSLRLRLVTTE
jgi:hypothetical protein